MNSYLKTIFSLCVGILCLHPVLGVANDTSDSISSDGISVAYSSDGLNFTKVGEIIIPGRFVGSVVYDARNGEFKIYHIPAPGNALPPDAKKGSWIYVTGIRSLKQDGSYEFAPGTESPLGQQVWVEGVNPDTWNAEDPSITLLSDGSSLLHYFENKISSIDPMCFPDTSEFIIGVATSSDGVNFVKQGTALKYQKLMDPNVFYASDQRWHLLASNSVAFDRPIVNAVSENGMEFEVNGTINIENPVTKKSAWIPRVTELPNGGGYRMYYNSPESPFHVYSAFSQDGNLWESEDGIRLNNAGKTSVVYVNGIYWAFYSYGGPDADETNEAGVRQPSLCLNSDTTPWISFLGVDGTFNYRTLMGTAMKFNLPPVPHNSYPTMILDRLCNDYFFVRDIHGTIWYHTSHSHWLWQPFNGTFSSDPAAIIGADGKVYVFALGVDGAIKYRTLFEPWQSLGHLPQPWPNFGVFQSHSNKHPLTYKGGISEPPRPKPILGADGKIYVFIRDSQNQLRYRSLNAESSWSSLGGILIGDPTVVRGLNDTTFHVFARCKDGNIWQRSLQCSNSVKEVEAACNDWVSKGGSTTDNPVISDPVAITTKLGESPVFVVRADGAIWYQKKDTDWTNVGGNNIVSVIPLAGKDYNYYVFAVDKIGKLFYRNVEYPDTDAWIYLDNNILKTVSLTSIP